MTTSQLLNILWTLLILPFVFGPGCAHDKRIKTAVQERFEVEGWSLELTKACYLYAKKGKFEKSFKIFESSQGQCAFVKTEATKIQSFQVEDGQTALLVAAIKPRITENLCHLRYRGLIIEKDRFHLQEPPFFKYSSCPENHRITERHWKDIQTALHHGLVESYTIPETKL